MENQLFEEKDAESASASASETASETAEEEYSDSASEAASEADSEAASEADSASEAASSDASEEALDTSWVDEFKAAENKYNEFYKEPVTSIAIYLMYVNREKELEHVHRDRCLLEPNGILKREVILSFVKRYQSMFSTNYKIKSLLKYNIDLDPSEINDFLYADNTQHNHRFIKPEKYLNDIHYADSIHMFQDMNALFYIFTEDKPTMNHTKRISFNSVKHKTKRNNNKKNLKIYRDLV